MQHYYRRPPDIASRIVDGEAVLVRMPGNEVFMLNHAASRMWVGTDGTRTAADLAHGLDTSAVQAFLDEMCELGLILRSSSPAEAADTFPQVVDWPETTMEPPCIRASETIEVLAGICDSAWGGESNCMLEGACLFQWN